jgi:hypothetical protein
LQRVDKVGADTFDSHLHHMLTFQVGQIQVANCPQEIRVDPSDANLHFVFT